MLLPVVQRYGYVYAFFHFRLSGLTSPISQWKKYLTMMQIIQFVIDIFLVYFGSLCNFPLGSCSCSQALQLTNITPSPTTCRSLAWVIAPEKKAPLCLVVLYSRRISACSSTFTSKRTRSLLRVLKSRPTATALRTDKLTGMRSCVPPSIGALI